MKFGPVPLAEASGAILAHSLHCGRRTIKKGTVLREADIALLHEAGYGDVIVARLEPGDLDENDSAAAVARASAGENVTVGPAATGRCNLFAARRGIVMFDPAAVDKINLVDENVTVATVPPFRPIGEGEILATVKIISFGVPDSVIAACSAAARPGEPSFRVAAYEPKRIGLLQTLLPGLKTGVIEKMVEVTRTRLRPFGSELRRSVTCGHDAGSVEAALRELSAAEIDILLVLGASAIVDRRDVVPAAVEAAGGAVEHLGMPVDPGNLMLLASLGEMRILGLPGSARSPRLHGFDWVLQRLHAGLDVTGRDLMLMGVGGLLKDIPARPLPRAAAAPLASPARDRHPISVAAVILAGGQSRRMGKANKLLADVGGAPMVRRVAEAALASRARPVVVVTGHEAERVRKTLEGLAVDFVHNPDFREGLSASLRHGLGALSPDTDGALICLGDMPLIGPEHLDRLIAAFERAPEGGICVPVRNGKRGNPVLWARRYFDAMREVSGDVGARHLIGENSDSVHEVEVSTDAVLVDVDSPEALAALQAAESRRA